MSEHTESDKGLRFKLFKWDESRPYTKDTMYLEPMSGTQEKGWSDLCAAGYHDGAEVKLLFSSPGFSLTHAWFKSGVPLPRHSHNVDCLYYIVSGSLRIGSSELTAGDGFFVGTDVPYSYIPGDDGLEILEFRTGDHFNMKFLADNQNFWAKAIDQVISKKSEWKTEEKPTPKINIIK